MITVTIFINDRPLYTRSCVNVGESDKLGNWCRYKCDDGSVIIHDYDAGAVELAKQMLDTIVEVKKS